MSFIQVLFLSIIQGLTEFLPISSSGHLVILQKFFGLEKPPVLFDVLLHVGTLGAILIYFRNGLARILFGLVKKNEESINILRLVFIGTIPAGVLGFLFEKKIEMAFDSLKLVGISFLITAALLFSTKWVKGMIKEKKGFSGIKWLDALIIGVFQAIAILPGVSRSGSTIIAGLWQGLSPEVSFVFSFYLAIPAILGAFFLKSGEISNFSQVELVQGFLGMIIAGTTGYFSLRILENLLKSAKLFWFGIYCFVLGMIILLV